MREIQAKDLEIDRLRQEHQSELQKLAEARREINIKNNLINDKNEQIRAATLESERKTTVHNDALKQRDH